MPSLKRQLLGYAFSLPLAAALTYVGHATRLDQKERVEASHARPTQSLLETDIPLLYRQFKQKGPLMYQFAKDPQFDIGMMSGLTGETTILFPLMLLPFAARRRE